jgi:hypothetical protein
MSTGLYFRITDGTTTVTFNDGTLANTGGTHPITDWSPAVASLRRDTLGGRGRYEDVIETATFDIIGADAPTIYTRLQTLNALLDQAERWALGEKVAAVIIQYSPVGGTTSSTSNPLQAVVLGRAQGDTTQKIALPSDYPHTASGGLALRNITLRIWRRGAWHLNKPTTGDGTTTRVSSSASATNTALANLTFTGTSPTDRYPLAYALLKGTSTYATSGYLAITRQNTGKTNAYVRDAGNFSLPSGNFSAFNDATNLPRQGTSVMRCSPPDTTLQTSPGGGSVSTMYRPVFIVSLRNNSSTQTWLVRMRLDGSDGSYTYTDYQFVDASSTQPRFIRFSPVGLQYNLTYTIRIEMSVSSTTGSPTLDVNYFAVFDSYESLTQIFGVGFFFSNFVVRSAEINDDVASVAYAAYSNDLTSTPETTTSVLALALYGSSDLAGYGNEIQVLPMLHTGAVWAQTTSLATPALDTLQHIVTRRLSYPVPA